MTKCEINEWEKVNKKKKIYVNSKFCCAFWWSYKSLNFFNLIVISQKNTKVSLFFPQCLKFPTLWGVMQPACGVSIQWSSIFSSSSPPPPASHAIFRNVGHAIYPEIYCIRKSIANLLVLAIIFHFYFEASTVQYELIICTYSYAPLSLKKK